MSNEELQNIINEAARARRLEFRNYVERPVETPTTPVEAAHTPTPVAERPAAQNLEDDAVNAILSQYMEPPSYTSEEGMLDEDYLQEIRGTDADPWGLLEQNYDVHIDPPEDPDAAQHLHDLAAASVEYMQEVSERDGLSDEANQELLAQDSYEAPIPSEGITSAPESSSEEQEDEDEEGEWNEVTDPREATIPRELDTAEQRESTSRFSGAEWFQIASNLVITLAGVGGIGSWAALLLSRLHPSQLFLYDPDNVELGNLSGQLYSTRQLGQPKVNAVTSTITDYSDFYSVSGNTRPFDNTCPPSRIMISGFDNMEARRTYYNAWKSNLPRLEEDRKQCLYIDARMAAEDIQILCMTGEDEAYMKEYEEKWLFSDEEADSTVCSYKQTSFCAAIIGGLITNLLVNFCTNLGTPLINRPLPFLTSYDASTMFLNIMS